MKIIYTLYKRLYLNSGINLPQMQTLLLLLIKIKLILMKKNKILKSQYSEIENRKKKSLILSTLYYLNAFNNK